MQAIFYIIKNPGELDINQGEALYVIRNLLRNVIHRRWYVIDPKEETYKVYALITYSSQGELITYALRRLHTNPSDWIKNKTVRRLSYFLELLTGIEPVTSSLPRMRSTI